MFKKTDIKEAVFQAFNKIHHIRFSQLDWRD